MNLFPKETSPYFITSPSYTHTSSGVRTLHLLCHLLNELGHKAYIVPEFPDNYALNPYLNTPIIGDFPAYINYYGNSRVDPIVIYHNLVKGNPLSAKRVVRYLLAPRGSYKGETVFGDNDQIWGSLPSIADNVLRIPVSDTSIFYNDNRKRSGNCFYSHKYDRITGNKLLPISDGCTRLEGSLKEIGEILRSSETCYLYEVSSIMTEAALCGCKVVLVRTPQFETIDPACMMGDVRWDDGEIVKECSAYIPEYQAIIDNVSPNLEEFILKTQAIV